MYCVAVNPSVLILDDDAAEFAALVSEGAPSIEITVSSKVREAIAAYDGQQVLFGSPDKIAQVLPEVPAVEWVQSTWAGVTPLIKLGRRDYVLTGVKEVLGPQMAEYVVGYVLAHELRIVRRLEARRARSWWPGKSGALPGKRMGILGPGSIGRAIAMKARSLGVAVVGLSRSGAEVPGFDSVYPATHLNEFLGNLDYLVSVLPDTPATDNLLNAETLAELPRHAIFINVGRANVVDDAALIDALQNGHLAGAVLDVFDQEPVPEDSPLWDAPNLLMTAHMAAISHPDLIAPIFLDNYRRFIAGRELMHVVDFDAGY